MRVLRGVVYMTKRSGPRTEPWGTPQEEVCQEDRSVSHFTRKQRDNGALSLSIICNSLRKRMLLLRTLPCFSELSIKLVY